MSFKLKYGIFTAIEPQGAIAATLVGKAVPVRQCTRETAHFVTLHVHTLGVGS